MVEVFKTNVALQEQACKLLGLLLQRFPSSRINFDLEDCDKILRVEGHDFIIDDVMLLLRREGFACSVLD
jgi:hypothetical protein